MDIDKLQKALMIINRSGNSGNVFAEHDELSIYPNDDSFTEEDISSLEKLGFYPSEMDDGFMCFT